MVAHPNAQILARLAEIAKTDPEPWKRLEVETDVGWVNCTYYDSLFHPKVVFRIKPATVNIGGVELEGPLRETPAKGADVWVLFDPAGESADPRLFADRLTPYIQWLNEGRLFATKEARDKYQNALVKLATGAGHE